MAPVVLFSLAGKAVYGMAGSLENLQNELNRDEAYKAELVNYIISHNMTVYSDYGYPINPNSMYMIKLEQIVKNHMQECQSGIHDMTVYMVRKTNDSEVMGILGHC